MTNNGILLALSGGGARGLAHLGVLQVLEREGIPIAGIAGTSMGGVLGALYAAGIPLQEIEKTIVEKTAPRELMSMLGVTSRGIGVRAEKVYDALVEALHGDVDFDELRIPLVLVATDVLSGREVLLREGPVAEAVRATMSVPGVFDPVERDGLSLVDGGVLHNLPVGPARSLDPAVGQEAAGGRPLLPVIAVDVLPYFAENRPGSPPVVEPLRTTGVAKAFSHLFQVAMVALAEMTALRLRLEPADLVVRPQLSPETTILFGFESAQESIAAGRKATEEALPAIRALL